MKRLIVCCDGTWNRPGIKDRGELVRSNVELIYNCITNSNGNIPQIKIYESGVGSSTFSWRDKLLGGIKGLGIDKNIKDVYSFLMMNYECGDEIYIFGFSRGAYTSRSLTGLIRNCGILKPGNLHLVDHAYELYRDRNDYTTPDSDMMIAFRKNFCFENITGIKFLGVWDTVGSLGIPLSSHRFYNKERYKFYDVKISSTVDFAYHALAVDERRKLFMPTLWELSNTVKNDSNHPQVMEQRWFPGVHCNIGGGYLDHGLSDLALKWLVEKAQNAGLKIETQKLKELNPVYSLQPDHKGEIRNSYTPMYWFWWPARRKIKDGVIHSNEVIDESVHARLNMDAKYRPSNIN